MIDDIAEDLSYPTRIRKNLAGVHLLSLRRLRGLLRWLYLRRTEGSWLWVTVALAVGIIGALIQYTSKQPHNTLLEVFTPPLALSMFCLAIISLLFSSMFHLAIAFEKEARVFFRHSKEENVLWKQQRKRIRSVKYSYLVLLLAEIAVILACIPPKNPLASILRWIVGLPLMYYASFGIPASFVVFRAVSDVCKKGTSLVNIFHHDRMGGLGFAKRYTDGTSILLFSGSLTLPMAVQLAIEGNREALTGNGYGLLAFLFVIVLILTWALGLFFQLNTRITIFWTLMKLRTEILHIITEERQQLVLAGKDARTVAGHRIKEEKAAFNLRTGVLVGSGAWRDFVNICITILVGIVTAWLQLK